MHHRYRHQEFGTALLREAVRLGRERGWSAGVGFAGDHAHRNRNGRALSWFLGIGRKAVEDEDGDGVGEGWAKGLLEDVTAEVGRNRSWMGGGKGGNGGKGRRG